MVFDPLDLGILSGLHHYILLDTNLNHFCNEYLVLKRLLKVYPNEPNRHFLILIHHQTRGFQSEKNRSSYTRSDNQYIYNIGTPFDRANVANQQLNWCNDYITSLNVRVKFLENLSFDEDSDSDFAWKKQNSINKKDACCAIF